MKSILITGGQGDIAKALYQELKNFFHIEIPSRQELDVTSIESVDKFFANKKFDIVINNAGTLYSSLILDSDPELWIRDINVNLIGTYLVSRAALLNNKSTHIINISSTAAYNSYKDWMSYCAAKAGVLKISEGLYKDNYKVNTLCPGAIDTKIRKNLKINNSNIMTIEEAIKPFVDMIELKYNFGDILFYRKNEYKLNPNLSNN
ncbi:NAD(P)-dependent oxidoreductase [Photobacterium kishitanii]|uniref:SDR family oxidoreductase n=1 Tax=Photobacterium kishitanii TaxID=318456 RepID=UPI000D177C9B|nr:SDR family oxidoreductase [Photobacterium kishitanii]PSV10868.1 NAD(P)-dependent oxidoreductase [Photobacterium kishitanii]